MGSIGACARGAESGEEGVPGAALHALSSHRDVVLLIVGIGRVHLCSLLLGLDRAVDVAAPVLAHRLRHAARIVPIRIVANLRTAATGTGTGT